MTALLLLVLSVVFSVLAWEVHGLRQTVRDRFARTNAELHTIEANLAVYCGILDGLKSDTAAMVEEDQRTSGRPGNAEQHGFPVEAPELHEGNP